MSVTAPGLGQRVLDRTALAMRPPDDWLGRRVFGNANRLSTNLRGANHIWRARSNAVSRPP